MKIYLIIFITLLLSNCSTLNLNRIAPGYVEAFKTLEAYVFGNNDSAITPEIIDKIPYASLLIKIGNGPEGLMILESKDDSKSFWVSADDVYLLKSNGKIIQTKGLSNNLDEIIYSADFSNLLKIDTNQTYIYYASFSEPKLNNLKLESKFFIKEGKSINLYDSIKFLTLIEEKVSSKELGWYITNKYWVDNNSYIWKSEQFISPKIPKLFLEITKKPSE